MRQTLREVGYIVLAVLVVWAWSTIIAERADAQPAEHLYQPPDSLIPWCYDGFTGSVGLRFPNLTMDDLRSMGILLTIDRRNGDASVYQSDDGIPRPLIPLAMLDPRWPPDNPGWPDETFGIGGWKMPQGMPDLYYQCVYWILSDTFEGHLLEEQAWGAWHFESYWTFVPDSIPWDCCPPSLWPHPAGCVRQLSRWWQDPDTLYWSHWHWQIRWNSAVGGHWEIVGGIPGGGWWSPHMGAWIMSEKAKLLPRGK